MTSSAGVLALTEGMPERRLQSGDVLYGQGEGSPGEVAVFVDGAVQVEVGGAVIAEITTPGAFIGEIGALLGTDRTATVLAVEPSTVRVIGDPDAFFATNPDLALELARQLAGRLHRLLAYLADMRAQFADAGEHLQLIDSVLGRLATRPPVEIDGGSERAPDY